MECKRNKYTDGDKQEYRRGRDYYTPYKELIGCLLFMSMNNQSNITYAMPTISLWKASKRVLRYLKRTPVKGLNYRRTAEEKNLVAYGDADWAADKVDRKCTSGCAVFYCGSLIHWFSKKQTSVTLSTAEAEYVVAAQSACGILKEYYKVLHLCH